MGKFYLEDSILLSFQWELTQAQAGALNCFSPLLVAYLTELLDQEQESLFPLVIVQLLSQNSQKLGESITVH